MPWCPECGTEYESGVTNCGDCGAELVDQAPPRVNDPVVVLEARSITEAQIAEATLEAEGIEAFVQNIASTSPNVGVMGDDVPELEVLVAPEDAARAHDVLNEPRVSDEELDAAAASNSNSDPVDAIG